MEVLLYIQYVFFDTEGNQGYQCSRYEGLITVELQWLEQLWNYENMFETGVVRGNE